jgi:hypothetical protein
MTMMILVALRRKRTLGIADNKDYFPLNNRSLTGIV